jgi:MFS family permease
VVTVASLTTPSPYLSTVRGMLQAAKFLGMLLGPLFGGVFADLFGLRRGFVVAGTIMVVLTVLVTAQISASRKRARAAGASAVTTGDPGATEDLMRRLATRKLVAAVSVMAAGLSGAGWVLARSRVPGGPRARPASF